MAIMEVIKWQESGYKNSNFQILAARFPSIMNTNDMKAAREELNYIGLDRATSKKCSTDAMDGTARPSHNWSQ